MPLPVSAEVGMLFKPTDAWAAFGKCGERRACATKHRGFGWLQNAMKSRQEFVDQTETPATDRNQ